MRWTLLLRGKASGSAISAKRTARRTVLLAVVYVSIEMRWIARSEAEAVTTIRSRRVEPWSCDADQLIVVDLSLVEADRYLLDPFHAEMAGQVPG